MKLGGLLKFLVKLFSPPLEASRPSSRSSPRGLPDGTVRPRERVPRSHRTEKKPEAASNSDKKSYLNFSHFPFLSPSLPVMSPCLQQYTPISPCKLAHPMAVKILIWRRQGIMGSRPACSQKIGRLAPELSCFVSKQHRLRAFAKEQSYRAHFVRGLVDKL